MDMLDGLDWLALEVKYLDPALEFYREHLDLAVASRSEHEVSLTAGASDLILRAPGPIPRGGLHTHYAFAIPREEYDEWWDALSRDHDLTEHSFGTAKSLYLYDPDGHCVELGQRSDGGTGITGIFEVVLEVEDLDRAESFYSLIGATVVDRGSGRQRVRLDLGPVDLELWRPQLGLADARGGVHVDLGFRGDPDAVATAVGGHACAVERESDRAFLRDPDGHTLTVRG